ncbi:MAG: hypothetical protein NTX63_01880 [Candidatus Peregrinibacteria bacterium]|nr:hypothetical protein [Candidatus Peregrinibacteria bacterium]
MTFSKIIKANMSFLAISSLVLTTGCSLVGIGNKTEKLEKLGISVERPASWSDTKIQNDDQYIDYVVSIPQTTTDKSNVEGHIAISVVKPLGDKVINLEDELSGLEKYIGANVTEMKEIENKEVQLLGEKAKRVTLQFRNSEDKSISEKVAITLTVKNNKAYSIILDEDPTDFDKQFATYEKMAQSMALLQ